ncbi:hypothetical protein NPIL_642441 [Nephila pilipes]|uniref:Uncharacterized protein n=1 Tax=Nephila pilipes TaxID=299642 RepID=A0A8X6TQ27_NEPPI|nr:hypothetical protein NPIL_642441 [Nephila pilipes]
MSQSLYPSSNFESFSNHVSMSSAFSTAALSPQNFLVTNPWRILQLEIYPFGAELVPVPFEAAISSVFSRRNYHPLEYLKHESARNKRRELFPIHCK